MSLSNPAAVEITVSITSLKLNDQDLGSVRFVDLNTCTIIGTNSFTLGVGVTLPNVAALTQNAASSANGTLELEYTVSPASVGGDTVTAQVNAAPPINGASCRDFSAAEKACLASLQPAPVITAINPTSGTAGDGVTLTGVDFIGTQSVTFGGVPVAAFTVGVGTPVPDGTQIDTTVPAGAPLGPVNVVVTTLAGSGLTGFTVT